MEKENYQMHEEASKDSFNARKGHLTDGQGRMGPQGKSVTGGGGLARVPNLHVCANTHGGRVAHAGRGRAN